MDKSFDFAAVLKKNEKKHKSKPIQFASVAGGVQKRLADSLKLRKSNRRSVFDSSRNISSTPSPSPSPAPLSEAQQKIARRRQQLEKWKQEKEKKKEEHKVHKKKPFVTGVVRNPQQYVPPPPPKNVPSTSGRVTRSQTARNKINTKEEAKAKPKSFAPEKATFHAPQIKDLPKIPKLAPPKARKGKVINITFEPVLGNNTKDKTNQTKPDRINIDPKTTEPHSTKRVGTPGKGRLTKTPAISSSQSSASSQERDYSQIPSDNEPMSSNCQNSSTNSSTDSSISVQSCSSTELDSQKGGTPVQRRTRMSLPAMLPNAETKESKTSKTPRASLQRYPVVNLTPYTPKSLVPKSESSSEEKLRSREYQAHPIDIVTDGLMFVESKISPSVTMSRGKENARKEMKKKLAEGLLDEDSCDADIAHFRNQLASEMKRLTEMCETWDKILEQVTLPEPVQELVLAAVGQARLLMSQKLQQFAMLVERCARPTPECALVTAVDLHGFWDMVFMQVVNIDMRFKALEELQARNWMEEVPVKKVMRAKPVVVKPAVKNKPAATSRLRDMIAAARKAKKAESPPARLEEKTFEGGFFSVRSPAKPPAVTTPTNKHNLLKVVLSSEAKKTSASASRSSASFAMLRASVLGKNVECDGVALLPQTPVNLLNLAATPGRSILKQTQDNANTSKKSIKVVLFNDSDDDVKESPKTSQKNVGQDKENIKKKLTRQDATEESPGIDKQSSNKPENHDEAVENNNIQSNEKTKRSARKNSKTPRNETERTPRRARQSSEVEEEATNELRRTRKSLRDIGNVEEIRENTPRRNARVQTVEEFVEPDLVKKPQRRGRKSKVEDSVVEVITPRRSTRSRKSVV